MYSCAVTADSRGKKKKKKKSYSRVCPPKSDTDAANSFGVVSQASGQGDENLPWPNERVLLPGLNTPPPFLLPWGVKAVLSGAGSRFAWGKQARQASDKQFSLNKAFRYKGRATTGLPVLPLEAAADPGLPVTLATPPLHSSIMSDRCQAQLEDGFVKMQSLWKQNWHRVIVRRREREGKLSH